jgi:hypothetical protein
MINKIHHNNNNKLKMIHKVVSKDFKEDFKVDFRVDFRIDFKGIKEDLCQCNNNSTTFNIKDMTIIKVSITNQKYVDFFHLVNVNLEKVVDIFTNNKNNNKYQSNNLRSIKSDYIHYNFIN